MLDCKTGEVLWSDNDAEKQSITVEKVGVMAKDVLNHLP